MANETKTMTINLPTDEYAVLERYCEKWDMSKIAVVRKALRQLQFVERLINTHGQTLEVLMNREFPPKCLPHAQSALADELCPMCHGWGNLAEVSFAPCGVCNTTGVIRH